MIKLELDIAEVWLIQEALYEYYNEKNTAGKERIEDIKLLPGVNDKLNKAIKNYEDEFRNFQSGKPLC